MLHVFNEGISERMRKTSTLENSTLTWKRTVRIEGTINPAMMASEVVSSEEYVDTAWSHQTLGEQLDLLQVNCRSTLNKVLEFWNLVDTYDPDVIIGTESWLREEINNAEVFRDDYKSFRKDRCTRVCVVFICVKKIYRLQGAMGG
jgi:hypothetical protein